MSRKNDISYGRLVDSGFGMRYSDSDVDQASDDSDASAAPSRRGKGSAKSSRSRGPKLRTLNRWTLDEHDRLAYLVAKWGSEKNWAKVAEEMPGRTGKQCRERWLNHMRPGIIKGNWSFEEEFLLAQCHAVVGSHWSKMTKRLPGRTENSIKNFWNATLRSKAPHKRRGVLWLYMQQQTCQEGENMDAFLVAVARLYENQELPASWAQLMEEGRLTDRTLRAVLRAEKDFLENPDAELHPLALPHPTHGLSAVGETDTADVAAAATAPTATGAPAATAIDIDAAAAATAHQPRPAVLAPGYSTSQDGGRSAAAAGKSYQPAATAAGPGLTPRCPGGEVSAGNGTGVACPAAFAGCGGLGGLALPPEMLAALVPQEAWPCQPAPQAPAEIFCAASGGMEPLMPTLGLNSDLHPSGQQPGGAFGGGVAGGLLALGHDTIWSCLPSFRGLCSTGFGAPPAAGAYTPHGGDLLKLLEPYGALQGHHSGSSVHTRPDSALEYQHPAQNTRQAAAAAAAGADSQGLSRHSSSRPGSSMGTQVLLPTSTSPACDLQPHSSMAQQQQRQQQAASKHKAVHGLADDASRPQLQHSAGSRQETAAQQGQYSPDTVLQDSYPAQHRPPTATGQTTSTMQPWLAQGSQHMPSAGMQSVAGYGAYSWDSSCQQQPGARGSSPTDSVTHSEQACGAAPYAAPAGGSAHAAPTTAAGSGAGCIGHPPLAHNSNPWAGNHMPWNPAARLGYQQQQQYAAHSNHQGAAAQSAWVGAAYSTQQGQGQTSAQQQHMLGHRASAEHLDTNSGLQGQQHAYQPAAPPQLGRLQQQHSSTQSPFASQASAGWGTVSTGGIPAATAQEAASAHAAPAAGAAQRSEHGSTAPQTGRQDRPAAVQLGCLPGAVAASLFSPQSVDSPMTGALQHLLDSAAAHAGVRTQDICAWLASASTGQGPAQHREQQRQHGDHASLPSDWHAGDAVADPVATYGRGQMVVSGQDDSSNVGADSTSAGAQETNFACSILETLLGPRHSAQLGDVLMSPAGLFSTATLLQGSLPPTPSGGLTAAAALQAAVIGIKRERSLPDANEELLIEQPGFKLPRVC